MEHTVWCTFLLLVVAVSVRAADEPSEDYLPRSIRPNEDSMPERPPSQEQTPLSFAASLKPIEFQYMVPLDAPVQSEQQAYRYEVQDQSPEEEDIEEEELQQQQLPSRAEIETVLKKYFGSKSKYLYNKDQVGIVGKESRFRRSAAGGSGASASSSASSSSYSSNDSPIYFGQQDFNTGFGSFGANGGAAFAGFGGGDGGSYGGGYNQGFASNSDDGLNMRFGGDDSVRGVYSGASSSIDSNGKATYSVKTGKF